MKILVVRIWWNWQTRYFEVVVPQGVQVQVLPCAPFFGVLTTLSRVVDFFSQSHGAPMKLAALLVATFLLLSGCASAPPVAKIQGHYTVRGEGWHAYEDITLRNGNFRWLLVTD